MLETYRMIAHDRGWNRSLEDAENNGQTAEAAVERVRSQHRARQRQSDESERAEVLPHRRQR